MKILIAGCSASGKDLARAYLTKTYQLNPVVSHTTRPQRVGEVDGKDYHFVPEAEFLEHLDYGDFLEVRWYKTMFNGVAKEYGYGTHYMEMIQDGGVCGIKDLLGSKQIKQLMPETIIIYIHSDDELRKQRAMMRGSFCEVEWSRRCIADSEDFKQDEIIRVCDYYVNNNMNEANFKQDLDNIMEMILGEYDE